MRRLGNGAFEQGLAIPQLSERLVAALEFLHERIAAGRAAPTEEEIGRRVGCTGSNAHNLLVRLSREGLVILAGGKHRAVRINYQRAAPVLFLADARRVLATGGRTSNASCRINVSDSVYQELLAVYASWCEEASCQSVSWEAEIGVS